MEHLGILNTLWIQILAEKGLNPPNHAPNTTSEGTWIYRGYIIILSVYHFHIHIWDIPSFIGVIHHWVFVGFQHFQSTKDSLWLSDHGRGRGLEQLVALQPIRRPLCKRPLVSRFFSRRASGNEKSDLFVDEKKFYRSVNWLIQSSDSEKYSKNIHKKSSVSRGCFRICFRVLFFRKRIPGPTDYSGILQPWWHSRCPWRRSDLGSGFGARGWLVELAKMFEI